MRRVLVVLLVLVSSVLLLQLPAYAYHRFFSATLVSKSGSGTFSVETNCPPSRIFEMSSPSFSHEPTVKTGSVKVRVPKGKADKAGVTKFKFTTEKLSGDAHGTTTLAATCDGHPLSVGRPNSGENKQAVSLDLARTGVPGSSLLALGLGLALAGCVLVAFGRLGGSSSSQS